MAELDEWYVEPPPGENAADHYLEAAELIAASAFPFRDALPILGDAVTPPLGTPLPEEMRGVIGAFLEEESEAFELIDEGSQFENARYPIDFSAAPPFTHLSMIRNATRGQILRTIYHSGHSDADVVVAEYEKLVRVARSIRDEPMLIASMVYQTTVGMAVSTAEQILNENALTREQLANLDASLALLLEENVLVRAFVGERCFGTSMMHAQNRIPVIGGLYRADYTGALDDLILIAEEGLPIRLDEYAAERERTPSRFRPFSSIIAPALLSSVQSYHEMRATILAARSAIAVQIWRLNGGVLPETREDFPDSVTQAWSIDPFSGQPLIYKRLDEGFIIYSVGGDMNDDGGATPEPSRRRTGPRDVIFRILK
jgi:hypothetical protein